MKHYSLRFFPVMVFLMLPMLIPAAVRSTCVKPEVISITHHVDADSVEAAHLVIVFADNSELRLLLDDRPKFESNNEDFDITSGSIRLTVQAVGILSCHFETVNVSTGINDALTEYQDMHPAIRNGAFHFYHLTAGTVVTLYDVQGRVLKRCKADADGQLVIPLHDLPKGVCIVRTPTQSFKVTNR